MTISRTTENEESGSTFSVYEVFDETHPHGAKKYLLYSNKSRFKCEVWAEYNKECTRALSQGWSHFEIIKES